MTEIERLRELVKSRTPATLTQAEKERMPPVVWVSKEDNDKVREENKKLKKKHRDLEHEIIVQTMWRESSLVAAVAAERNVDRLTVALRESVRHPSYT